MNNRIATAIRIDPNTLLISPVSFGSTTLYWWDQAERHSLDISVRFYTKAQEQEIAKEEKKYEEAWFKSWQIGLSSRFEDNSYADETASGYRATQFNQTQVLSLSSLIPWGNLGLYTSFAGSNSPPSFSSWNGFLYGKNYLWRFGDIGSNIGTSTIGGSYQGVSYESIWDKKYKYTINLGSFNQPFWHNQYYSPRPDRYFTGIKVDTSAATSPYLKTVSLALATANANYENKLCWETDLLSEAVFPFNIKANNNLALANKGFNEQATLTWEGGDKTISAFGYYKNPYFYDSNDAYRSLAGGLSGGLTLFNVWSLSTGASGYKTDNVTLPGSSSKAFSYSAGTSLGFPSWPSLNATVTRNTSEDFSNYYKSTAYSYGLNHSFTFLWQMSLGYSSGFSRSSNIRSDVTTEDNNNFQTAFINWRLFDIASLSVSQSKQQYWDAPAGETNNLTETSYSLSVPGLPLLVLNPSPYARYSLSQNRLYSDREIRSYTFGLSQNLNILRFLNLAFTGEYGRQESVNTDSIRRSSLRFLLTSNMSFSSGLFAKKYGNIDGVVWEDLNGNGQRDIGEPFLNNIRVLLNAGQQTSETHYGNYNFSHLDLKTAAVEIDPYFLANGLVGTTPTKVTKPVDVNTPLEINFGCRVTMGVKGLVYYDSNNNDVYDPDEDEIIPWATVMTSTGQVLEVDENGRYVFFVEPEKDYSIWVNPGSLKHPFINANVSPVKFSLPSGEVRQINLAVKKFGSLRCLVWLDNNNNMIADSVEKPLTQAKVYLGQDFDLPNEKGEVVFHNLPVNKPLALTVIFPNYKIERKYTLALESDRPDATLEIYFQPEQQRVVLLPKNINIESIEPETEKSEDKIFYYEIFPRALPVGQPFTVSLYLKKDLEPVKTSVGFDQKLKDLVFVRATNGHNLYQSTLLAPSTLEPGQYPVKIFTRLKEGTIPSILDSITLTPASKEVLEAKPKQLPPDQPVELPAQSINLP